MTTTMAILAIPLALTIFGLLIAKLLIWGLKNG
jgi:nitrogen fixation-related uncharacterized protein